MAYERKWKSAAVFFALIPIAFLLYFALHSGQGGLTHYGQLLPIALLAIFGWYTPREAGFVLVFAALALMIIYSMSVFSTVPTATLALVEVIVFVPLLISGVCFLKAE